MSSLPFFARAASAAASLSEIIERASRIALEAMNAEVLVARSGERAQGFKLITEFMVRFAREITEIVHLIDGLALDISQSSVRQLRSADSLVRFQNAFKNCEENVNIEQVKRVLMRVDAEQAEIDYEVNSTIRRLIVLFDELDRQMIAVDSVISTARVEASRIGGEDGQRFSSVIEKFSTAAADVRLCISDNRGLVERAA